MKDTPRRTKVHHLLTAATALAAVAAFGTAAHPQANTAPPVSTVRLVFVHHSCGNNWLDTGNGNLGNTLGSNNYYVRDTYYGWDAPYNTDIGDSTDTTDWYTWFADTTIQGNGMARRDNIMGALYTTSNQNATYSPIADPGGENDIIMFKSCYPNSEVGGSISDEKALYNDLLAYFASRTDKLFVLVTPPGETNVSSWELTEELCNWLCDNENGWLSRYPYHNVAVFDFYNVLSETDAHHRIHDGQVQHYNSPSADGNSPYHNGDDHPNSTGNQKSTDEFVPLLNSFYNCWQNDPVRINFQPAASTVPSACKLDDGSMYGTRINYGWLP
jgi:hypothetical protein